MSERLRVGVVGLGFFGARHASIYADLDQAELVAVCDRDAERREGAASRTGAKPFAALEEMLAGADLDAVSVCLPDRHHEEAAVAVAEAGKAMLLEKPLAHDAAAAQRIVGAVEAAGTRLMVGHVLRFDPRYNKVFEAAAPERLGEVVHLRAERMGIRATAERLGDQTSILFYLGVHDVDAMQWVARSPIVRVYARERRANRHGSEDSVFATVDFANGAIGALAYSWAWPNAFMNGYRARLEIVGTKCAAALDVADQGFTSVTDEALTGGDTHLWPEIDGRIVGDLQMELEHFVRATLAGTRYRQHHREALAAIPVIDAIAASIRDGRPADVALIEP